jgi:hypothetical protein
MQANPKSPNTERTILALVLAHYPIFRTVPELGRELGAEAVERAVAELVDCEVIRLHGSALIPTRAALCCHRLEAW